MGKGLNQIPRSVTAKQRSQYHHWESISGQPPAKNLQHNRGMAPAIIPHMNRRWVLTIVIAS
jgi:hypothetical protein